MIGQNPPLEQQGLRLHDGYDTSRWDDGAFERYRDNLAAIRRGEFQLPQGLIHRDGESMLFFAHQLGNLAGARWQGQSSLKWSQGFGPFGYRAGPGGASLSVRVSGICSFLVTGGEHGARVTAEDHRSGFKFAPDLPAMMEQFASISVPGGPIPRTVTCDLAEGAVLYGLHAAEPQMLDTTFRFDWSQLPGAT
jgi:hypothetical protein